MIIFITTIVLAIIGLWLLTSFADKPLGFLGYALAFLCAAALIVQLTLIVFNRGKSRDLITAHKALKGAIEANPETLVNSEVMFKEVVSLNTKLLQYQYWNKRVLDIYVPDSIDHLKPIEWPQKKYSE